MIQGPPINIRGPTQHMTETVDHILFMVIFISRVSRALLYHLNISIYVSVTGILYTNSHLTIHQSNLQPSFYHVESSVAWRARSISFVAGSRPRFLVT